ncbi:hypothetical protein VKT23_020531 [Stygiomarasmius scandens]|uniref:Uncharacterized protein n=1 Tax=Marasmiellus scandens TaxID=2682957 RepID=A0ABR1IIV3_9AGAR
MSQGSDSSTSAFMLSISNANTSLVSFSTTFDIKFYPKKPRSKAVHQRWISHEKDSAQKGGKNVGPKSINDLQSSLSNHFDSSTEGRVRQRTGYLWLKKEVIAKDIQIKGKDEKPILSVFKLPPHLVNTLEACIKLPLNEQGFDIPKRDTYAQGDHSFDAFHFCYYFRYRPSGKDAPITVHPDNIVLTSKPTLHPSEYFPKESRSIQNNMELYARLQETLEPTIAWALAKVLSNDSEMSKTITSASSALPMTVNTVTDPFPSFVLNVGVMCEPHRDINDLAGCIIIPIGHFEGGELMLVEPKLVAEIGHGDVVAFNSADFTHGNLPFRGERASLVIQMDRAATSYQENGQFWDLNNFVH